MFLARPYSDMVHKLGVGAWRDGSRSDVEALPGCDLPVLSPIPCGTLGTTEMASPHVTGISASAKEKLLLGIIFTRERPDFLSLADAQASLDRHGLPLND